MKSINISLKITQLSPREEDLLQPWILDRQGPQPGPTLCSCYLIFLPLLPPLSSLQSQTSEHSAMLGKHCHQSDRGSQDRSTNTRWWSLCGPCLLPTVIRLPETWGMVVAVPAQCILWVLLDGNHCLTAGVDFYTDESLLRFRSSLYPVLSNCTLFASPSSGRGWF